ncbi:HAD-IA family hydrolase [Candidatus Saccharibacteria bacterium]|nr:HAD-IA family hydrolase [Candidatus Saccharibacteria bacterium]
MSVADGGVAIDEKALGKRLQLARRRAGLTQQELCHKAKLSYSTLAKIERGAIRSPSVFTVSAIAMATGTTVESLLGVKSSGGSQSADEQLKKISKTGVKFVYFDVNGTLVRFFHRAFTRIAEDIGKPVDIIETVYWRHNEAINKGQISMKEFNSRLAKELDIKDFDWQAYYLSNIEPMPGISELITWAAKHYEIGLLSNNLPGFMEELRRRKLTPDAPYTTIVDSSKVGTMKPEGRIYEVAQQLAGVDAKEILLVDDTRANLIAADKHKWHVLWFDDYRPAESIAHIREALAF